MKLTKREAVLLTILGIILAGYLYYYFVYVPQSEAISMLKQTYQNKRIVVARAKGKDARINSINAEIARLDDEGKAVMAKIGGPVRVPDIISELDNEAKNLGVKVESMSFTGDLSVIKGENIKDTPKAPQSKASNLKTLVINFTFSGKYNDCIALIKYYEQNERLFVVNKMKIGGYGEVVTGAASLTAYSTTKADSDFRYENVNGYMGRFSPFVP